MSVLQSGITKSLAEAYTIDQSLRFDDGDSAYLARTPTAQGSLRKLTFSAWVKKTENTGGTTFQWILHSGEADGDPAFGIGFKGDTLAVLDLAGSYTIQLYSTAIYRDPSAWYHVCVGIDTEQGIDTNRVKCYINGVQVTDFSTATYPSEDDDLDGINKTTFPMEIGRDSYGGGEAFFDGYLAEVYFIDGTQYAASDFGETDSATNQWKPIDAVDDLTFGTNGFYQKYAATELADSFTDSAEHTPHTITVGNDVHTDTTIKKIGTASAQFDGTDYLKVPHSSEFDFGSSAFTLECWAYFTAIGDDAIMERSDYNGGAGDGFTLQVMSNDKLRFYGGTAGIDSSTSVSTGTWYHIAVVSNASTFKLYLDGTEEASISVATIGTTGSPFVDIGNSNRTSYADGINGYLDEIRISNNARYTSAFTPSTTAFTADVNTMLLLHCDGADGGTTFTDSADGPRHAITANGDAANARGFGNGSTAIESFTTVASTTWVAPVGVTSVNYLVVAGGGSGGGGTDAPYVGAGGGGAGGFKTGSLSVTAGSSYTVTVGAGGATQAGTASDGNDGSDSVFSSITSTGGGGGGALGGSGATGGSGGGGPGNGSGGAGTGSEGFAGGDGTTTDHGAGGGGGASEVGADGSGAQGGIGGDGLSNTVSGTAGTFYGGGGGGGSNTTSGSAGGSGGGGTGGYANPGTVHGTAGTANTGGGGGGGGYINGDGGAGGSGIVIISYTRVLPGESSIYFDGTGDYLSTPDSSDWDLGSTYTVEFWAYGDQSGWSHLVNHGDATGWYIRWSGTDYEIRSNSNTIRTSGTHAGNDVWQHFAVVGDGTDVEVYVDGVLDSTGSGDAAMQASSSALHIATNSGGGSDYYTGYVDEIRISDSTRYTTTFTPQTTQFTADSNTLLLIHSDWNGGLGADSSGNRNTFTPTNLVATDQMVDSPTNNFSTINPLDNYYFGSTFSEGNLKLAMPDSVYNFNTSTFGMTSGKWYWEYYGVSNTGIGYMTVGISSKVSQSSTDYLAIKSWQWGYLGYNGVVYNDDSTVRTDSTYGDGDIVGIALDLDNNKLYFSKNNTWQDSGDPTSGATGTGAVSITALSGSDAYYACLGDMHTANGSTALMNFGSDSSFAGETTAQGNADGNSVGDFYYEPPTDYLALCTSNLSAPEIKLPGDNFNTVIWTGTGSSNAITGVGFQPDFTWIKNRGSARSHALYDAIRGATKQISSDNSEIEKTETEGLKSFDSDGFTVGTENAVNESTDGIVAWNWLGANGTVTNTDGTNIDSTVSANSTAGFSICKYTGTGTAGDSFGHGLSAVPDLVIIKRLDIAAGWPVFNSISGNTKFLELDTTAVPANADSPWNHWNDTSPDATIVTLGDSGDVNDDADDYISYVFHSVEGYSNIGSWTGNGNADGTFIYTGFRPAYVLSKDISSANNWAVVDDARNTYNVSNARLEPNDSDAESTSLTCFDFVSNGFKVRTSDPDFNQDTYTYFYMAFAESPFKYANAR